MVTILASLKYVMTYKIVFLCAPPRCHHLLKLHTTLNLFWEKLGVCVINKYP